MPRPSAHLAIGAKVSCFAKLFGSTFAEETFPDLYETKKVWAQVIGDESVLDSRSGKHIRMLKLRMDDPEVANQNLQCVVRASQVSFFAPSPEIATMSESRSARTARTAELVPSMNTLGSGPPSLVIGSSGQRPPDGSTGDVDDDASHERPPNVDGIVSDGEVLSERGGNRRGRRGGGRGTYRRGGAARSAWSESPDSPPGAAVPSQDADSLRGGRDAIPQVDSSSLATSHFAASTPASTLSPRAARFVVPASPITNSTPFPQAQSLFTSTNLAASSTIPGGLPMASASPLGPTPVPPSRLFAPASLDTPSPQARSLTSASSLTPSPQATSLTSHATSPLSSLYICEPLFEPLSSSA
jgi:hypothetical protein